MILPKNEIRKFKLGKLTNKIKFALSEDDKIDKTYISFVIKAGSFFDPKEYQGLAHFLEHMIFLGSSKYPKENYFDKKLKQYGGWSNAYTDTFETVYYFCVQSNNIEEILDIFTMLMIDPLFDLNSVNREINAINSEHMKNINNDGWRIYQIIKNISDKNSQINKFSTGNLQTLKKDNVRNEMIKFYKKYYVSENMTLSIISPLCINKLFSLVEKYFGKIKYKKSKNIDMLEKIKKPFYNLHKKAYHIIPSSNITRIMFIWEVPTKFHFFDTQIWSIIGEVIQNETKTNIEAFLKKNGLIKSLNIIYRDYGIFGITIDIVDICIKKITKIFQYLKYYLDEIKKYNWKKIAEYYQKKYKILFNYGSRINSTELAELFALNLQYYPLNNFYSGTFLINKINETKILEQLDYLDLNNSIQLFIYDINKKENFMKDKYYNTLYKKTKWINIDDKLKFEINISFDNPYYEIKPLVYKNLDEYEIPFLINKRQWYGAVSKFKESTVYSQLFFTLHSYFDTPINYLITDITCSIINYYIEQKFIQAGEVGYSTKIVSNPYNSYITVIFSGLNDKLNYYILQVLDYIRTIEIEDIIIESQIKKFKQILENINKLTPWKYINILNRNNIYKYSYDVKILQEEIVKIKNNQIKIFSKNIFKKSSLTTITYGNIKKNQILKYDMFKNNLKQIEYKKLPVKKIVSKTYIHPNIEEKNNLTELIYYIGFFNPKNIIKLLILTTIMEQNFYNTLRTQEQLGYLVSCFISRYDEHYYLNQKIQSDKSCEFIKERILNFNKLFLNKLKKMTKIKFNIWKKTVKEQLLEKVSNTSNLYYKYLNEIKRKKYLFNRNHILVQNLKKITLDDIIYFYQNNIIDMSPIIYKIKVQNVID